MAQQETVRAVELGAFGIRDRSIDRWRLVDNHRPFPQGYLRQFFTLVG